MEKGEFSCPYCQSKFENKDDLSRHIDRIHTGSGLLEGDVGKW
ncbi:MAG TPA: C2H2-type zinc finger protein [Nitrososphaeraceae archaeon]|nr:C2H2-type zinc finger protein [Nitrososphaeraceae archaeon]